MKGSYSNERYPVLSQVTPLQDLFFYERVDFKKDSRRDAQYGAPFGRKPYENHVLVYIAPESDGTFHRFYYAAPRENQDLYNYEYSQVDLGGRKFDTVVRTYVYLRSEFVEEDVQAGSSMPDGPDDKFKDKGYVLMTRTNKRIGQQELDSIFVIEQRIYIKKVSITHLGYDDLSSHSLSSVTTWYYRGEEPLPGQTIESLFANPNDPFWGMAIESSIDGSFGVVREGAQLSDDWFAVTSKQVIYGSDAGGGVINVKSYKTVMNYYWPPVLKTLEFLDWERQDGGTNIYPVAKYDPEGYKGPCDALIEIQWAIDPQTDLETQQMNPRAITYSCPYYRINFPPSLHTSKYCECEIGSTDPVFKPNYGSRRYFPDDGQDTEPSEWPNEIVASDDQRPHGGGYMRTKTTIYPPSNPPS